MNNQRCLPTDKGPPFNADEPLDYLTKHGVRHRRRHRPQADGAAERFMKTTTKAIRTTHAEEKDGKLS